MSKLHIMYLGLRFVFALLGIEFFYMAIFMFRDTHGRMQNRLVDMWIVIKQAQGSSAEFLRRSAALAEDGVAWVLGPKTISFKAGLISCYLSLASMEIAAATSDPIRGRRLSEAAWAIGIAVFALVVVRRVTAVRSKIALSLLCAMLPGWVVLQEMWPQIKGCWNYIHPEGRGFDATYVVIFGALYVLMVFLIMFPGMIADLLVIGVNRVFVKRSSHSINTLLIALVLLYDAAWATVIVLGFILKLDLIIPGWTRMLASHNELIAFAIVSPIAGGFFTALGCSTFFLVACIALAHKALWPALDRVLTAIAEFDVLSSRKVQASLCGLCLIIASGQFPSLLEVLKMLR